MGLYISREDVRVRLIGKVRFTEDDDDENRMNVVLLDRLINEAEGEVEHDLSPRYAVPFQTIAGQPFKLLPLRPTKELLRTLVELKAVMKVLDTDFGTGTIVNSEKYYEKLEKRYNTILERLMVKKGEKGSEYKGWMYPPLTDLKLAYFNNEADDGYAGMVLSTSTGRGGYAPGQVQSPGESFWNATAEDTGQDQFPEGGSF